jgi:8-oxo-dGTP diphosphatase
MPSGFTHLRIGAIGLVTDIDGRVLLVWQRGGPFAGSWLLPGGSVEPNESAIQAAGRELHEETGLTPTEGHLLAAYQVRSDPPGDYDITLFMFELRAAGEPQAEVRSKVAWFAPPDIPDPHPVLRRQLFDAEVGVDDAAAIDAALATAGIRMERLA